MAADPFTRSPARLPRQDPGGTRQPQPVQPTDVPVFEAELDAVGGRRMDLQRTAREQLAAERRPLTRATVITRAAELLHIRAEN